MTPKIVGCMSVPTIGRRCGTITVVCVHVHVSDNRESLCDAANNQLHVAVDSRETLCDEKSGFRACSRER